MPATVLTATEREEGLVRFHRVVHVARADLPRCANDSAPRIATCDATMRVAFLKVSARAPDPASSVDVARDGARTTGVAVRVRTELDSLHEVH